MTGDYPYNRLYNLNTSSSVDTTYDVYYGVGGLAQGSSYNLYDILNMIDIEKLWEKMYVKTMGVIVACSYCNTPQAIGNGTCSQCGSPLPKPKPLGEGI